MLEPNLLSVTEKAASKIKDIIVREGRENSIIRVALVRTHCMGGRGYSYGLTFEDTPSNNDQVVAEHGIRFCVDGSSARNLFGSRLDYVEDLSKQGFIVNNPNAISKCPCGHHDIFPDTMPSA